MLFLSSFESVLAGEYTHKYSYIYKIFMFVVAILYVGNKIIKLRCNNIMLHIDLYVNTYNYVPLKHLRTLYTYVCINVYC